MRVRGFAYGLALVGLMAAASGTIGQDQVPVPVATQPWQEVISSQIEAFRHKDAPAAFSYAGAEFQTAFASPQEFFLAIVGSGYGPIMESRSHTFGEFKMVGEHQVIQDVKLMGTDQGLYEALYQLAEEPAGWRVQGVQLVKQAGMGI